MYIKVRLSYSHVHTTLAYYTNNLGGFETFFPRCQASTGTTITMTVKKEKKEKKWYTFRGKSEKKELSITFTKPHEVKELLGCSIITVSSNDQVSVSLEVSRYSSCQIFELFVFGKTV